MKAVLPALALLLIAGCATTRELRFITDAREALDGESGSITLARPSILVLHVSTVEGPGYSKSSAVVDTMIFDATGIRIDTLETSFTDRGTGERIIVPNADISRVELVQRVGGAFVGFLLGGLGGAASGLLVASAISHGPESGLAGFAGLMVGGTAGVVVGTTIGVIRGHRQVYIFDGKR